MVHKIEIVYEEDDTSGTAKFDPTSSYEPPKDYSYKKSGSSKSTVKYGPNGRAQLDMSALFKTTKARRNNNAVLDSTQYQMMKQACVKSKKMFVDSEFPASKAMGGHNWGFEVEWKRPKEINKDADFIADKIERSDIAQGRLGDCWLLAVISSLTEYKELFTYVVPDDQCMRAADYCGIFHFRFWQFGQWREVIIDDLLPCVKGTNNLAFMHSTDQGEMWSALMEKAYAKLNGSYKNLVGGLQAEAMEDMTGGLCEEIKLKDVDENFPVIIDRFSKRCCLMGVSINSNQGEAKRSNGLVAGHAYSITAVDKVTYNGKLQWLVRCRNPWANAVEWTGAWSDKASEWTKISAAEKKRLQQEDCPDGEFWMAYEDFKKEFESIEICHLGAESLSDSATLNDTSRLQEALFAGTWKKNVTAGGCLNNAATFHTNPQFRITLEDADPNDNDDKCSVAIGLMQKNSRELRDGKFLAIGFCVYKVDPSKTEPLTREEVRNRLFMSSYVSAREVVKRERLSPGTYVIIPSTFAAGEEGDFILRVFTQSKLNQEVVDTQTGRFMTEEFKKISKEIHSGEHGHHNDEETRKLFDKYADKFTNEINVIDFMNILNATDMKNVKGFTKFELETCRTLFAATDDNISGSVCWEEFNELWECCEVWKYVFEKLDENKSGSLDAIELRGALKTAGYKVSNSVLEAVVIRYAHPATGQIGFADFVCCLAKLKNCSENYFSQTLSTANGRVFTPDDFMQYSIYT